MRHVPGNLCVRAEHLGIASTRLLLAPSVAPLDYQARYTAADLFLDADPFTVGTTTNKAP